MENCVVPGLDEFDVLLEVVLSLVRVKCEQRDDDSMELKTLKLSD